MVTSIRWILLCAGLAATGLGYACSDSGPAGSRTTGDTTAGTGTTGAGGNSGGTASSGTASSGTSAGGNAAGSTTTVATTVGAGGAGGVSATTGTGGVGTGGAGTGGAGVGGVACGSNGQPYTGPLLGRCDPLSCTDRNCGTSVAKGGFLTLDDFERVVTPPAANQGTIPMTWPSQDGRNGDWHNYSDPLAVATAVLAPAGAGGSPDSVQAMHFVGAKGAYGAALGLTLGGAMASGTAGCYDASAYDGFSFWVKGNPAAGNTQVKFNVQTPVSEPVLTGGACMGGCYDHFSVMVTVSANWTRVKVPWADLKRQACSTTSPATPPNFQPQQQILSISFSQVDQTKGFDYWFDDVTFDIDTRPATNFGSTFSLAMYNEMFKAPAVPYTYQGLVAAVSAHGSGLAGNPNGVDNKREAAAFLAQVAHETGSLTTAREKCITTCALPSMATTCTPVEAMRACTMGNTYYGRGAIQLTGQANYQAAESAGFAGIVANPDLVATNADFAFGTAVWFWMTPQSAAGVCHTAILGKNFGQTTRVINGGECGGTLQNARVLLFKVFCAALGINAGGTLTC